MNRAFSPITATNARCRRTSRYEPAAPGSRVPRSSDGEGTSANITPAYTTKVSEFRRKRTVNEPGDSVVAMRPPASAPRPMPRFITTRCMANAAGRCSGGRQAGDERRLRRPEPTDADTGDRGHDEPLPRLVDERIQGIAHREDAERDPEQPPPAQAVDQDAEDRAGDDADERVRADDQADDAEADPADVVQVDEQERQRDAVPERVDEPADLEGRDGAGQRRKVGAKDAAQPWDTSRVRARVTSCRWQPGDEVVWRETWRGSRTQPFPSASSPTTERRRRSTSPRARASGSLRMVGRSKESIRGSAVRGRATVPSWCTAPVTRTRSGTSGQGRSEIRRLVRESAGAVRPGRP